MSDMTTFADLGLGPGLVAGLAERAIIHPTPVQAALIPLALAGGDLSAQARTGSGKTLAFLLPIVTRHAAGTCARAWVVCPTRELAQQVAREAVLLLGPTRVATVVGGAPIGDQLRQLRREPLLICATPGRLVDMLAHGQVKPDAEVLILDEADQMLDLGFRDDLDLIVKDLGPGVERWCTSATFPPSVRSAVGHWLREPREVRLDTDAGSAHVPQYWCTAGRGQQEMALVRLLQALRPERALIFVRTREAVDQVVTRLALDGIEAAGISGDLAQEARERVLARFRAGALPALVATDVAARGLDVPGISHVFNLGLPVGAESYTHRVGRTGRAGAAGEAWTVLGANDRSRFIGMLRRAGCEAQEHPLPSPGHIAALRRERLAVQVREGLGEELALPTPFAELCAEHGAEVVLAALVHRLVPEPPPEPPPPPRPARGQGDPCSAQVLLDHGADDGLNPAVVVAMVCRATGMPGSQLGRMRIMGRRTILACSRQAAEALLRAELHHRGQVIQVRPDQGPPLASLRPVGSRQAPRYAPRNVPRQAPRRRQ